MKLKARDLVIDRPYELSKRYEQLTPVSRDKEAPNVAGTQAVLGFQQSGVLVQFMYRLPSCLVTALEFYDDMKATLIASKDVNETATAHGIRQVVLFTDQS
jgi:hypothetical protein